MDLDGFLKLNDAQRANSTAQAGIATQLADIPDKLAHADLTEAQAVRQWLEDVSKLYEISWDVEAYSQLKRMISISLQTERNIVQEQKRLNDSLLHIGALLAGAGSWDGINTGWIAFGYLRARSGLAAQIKAGAIVPAPEAYAETSWAHPVHALPEMPEHNAGALIDWATKKVCHPRSGSAGYQFVSDYISTLNEGAGAVAADIQSRIDKAHAAALALEQQDWDRLKNRAK